MQLINTIKTRTAKQVDNLLFKKSVCYLNVLVEHLKINTTSDSETLDTKCIFCYGFDKEENLDNKLNIVMKVIT